MERKEKEIRRELMQQIIDSRGGIMNTNFEYLASRKEIAKESSKFEPSEMWRAIAERNGQEEEEKEREQKLEDGT